MVNSEGQEMMWWVGRDKVKNSYWDGSHQPSEHLCACKKELSCTKDVYPCNCDAEKVNEWVSDVGLLTQIGVAGD
jgi:hypothetical protein